MFPARLITVNPLPKGFLPKVGPGKAKGWLYPDEDAALLSCPAIALCWRVYYGVLNREGPRASEAAATNWSDLDLDRTVRAIVDAGLELVDADAAQFCLREPRSGEQPIVAGPRPGIALPQDAPLFAQVLSGTLVDIGDYQAQPGRANGAGSGARSVLGIPIRGLDGGVEGALMLLRAEPNAYTAYLYLPAWLVAPLAAASRRWWLMAAALGVVALHVTWMLPDYEGRDALPTGAEEAPHLRVLTANLRERNDDVSGIINEVLADRPDIVFLQEYTPQAEGVVESLGLLEAYPYRVRDIRESAGDQPNIEARAGRSDRGVIPYSRANENSERR